VVATKVGLLQGQPKNTRLAYMANPGDDQSLAHAMEQCLANKARLAELAAAGQQEVKKYAWPDIAERAENLYGRVL
jgi:glycosyltransferase involved in cell wall biosynthesis